MTAKRTIGTAIGLVVAAVGALALARGPAAGGAGAQAFEYAQLYIREKTWVLYEAERETTIQPPTNPLRRAVDEGPSSPVAYTGTVRVTHNFSVGALNFVGARGWEAVDVTPQGNGRMVLLKRPR